MVGLGALNISDWLNLLFPFVVCQVVPLETANGQKEKALWRNFIATKTKQFKTLEGQHLCIVNTKMLIDVMSSKPSKNMYKIFYT